MKAKSKNKEFLDCSGTESSCCPGSSFSHRGAEVIIVANNEVLDNHLLLMLGKLLIIVANADHSAVGEDARLQAPVTPRLPQQHRVSSLYLETTLRNQPDSQLSLVSSYFDMEFPSSSSQRTNQVSP